MLVKFFFAEFNGDRGGVPILLKFDVDGVVDHTLSIVFYGIRIFVNVTSVMGLIFRSGYFFRNSAHIVQYFGVAWEIFVVDMGEGLW